MFVWKKLNAALKHAVDPSKAKTVRAVFMIMVRFNAASFSHFCYHSNCNELVERQHNTFAEYSRGSRGATLCDEAFPLFELWSMHKAICHGNESRVVELSSFGYEESILSSRSNELADAVMSEKRQKLLRLTSTSIYSSLIKDECKYNSLLKKHPSVEARKMQLQFLRKRRHYFVLWNKSVVKQMQWDAVCSILSPRTL